MNLPTSQIEALRSTWTDRYVRIKGDRPELKRFAGRVGRVITVNFNGKAIVDFADGAWYDVTASDEILETVTPEEAKGKYDATYKYAQPLPERQGP